MITTGPHHVIAIGASAGGMDEINTFFDNTPLDGVAYVIVQHLSPDFKSRMVELLSRHSKLFVQEAKNMMEIKANHVYLIPNDKFMTIRNAQLFLTTKENEKAPHLTINTFFNSLAASQGPQAIAVVLSGMGADGAEGIIAVKRAGGLVIARNPSTSKFPGMPSSAIATGAVDYVLEPSDMPEVIENYVLHQQEEEAGIRENENMIVTIVDFIKEQLPLDFSDYKLTTLLRRTKRRAASANLNSLEDYYNFLRAHPPEVSALAKDFLISVTSFFRDREAFDIIGNSIMPELLAKLEPGEELKLWIAGCATGEEVYSLAILVKEKLTGRYKDVAVKIFATDLDGAALLYAGKGLYPWNSVKDIPAEILQQYFIKEQESYRIVPAIRQMVIFAQHDLARNPPYCNMHFISCRNLLIYMTPFLQKKVFSMLLFGLKFNGYLFLGASETPASIIDNLEVISKKWRLYKNINKKRIINFDAFSLPESQSIGAPVHTRDNTGRSRVNDMAESVNEALAGELDCLAISINENYQVIKSYGDTSRYLLQQNFNTNLQELLPTQLALAFNTLISQVSATQQRASVSRVPLKTNGTAIAVHLTISPMPRKPGMPASFLVILKEDTEPGATAPAYEAFDERTYNIKYVSSLEQELKAVKEELSAAYERIDAYNENMQSFHEELISSNEEMQSTNEEMQSVNEELHTINADYQLKNKQLLEINDDLNNYFRSNINGQIFLDEQLRVMKFSPATVKLINLQEADIGRPIGHISTNIKMDSLVKDIKSVQQDGGDVSREIETNEGHWYQMVIMPYIQQVENKRKGVVISFNDISALKCAKIELDEKNESLLRINTDLDHFIHMASHDLLDPLSSIETSITLMNLVDNSNTELTHFLSIINSSIKRFRVLINNIATIAKLENNMTDMESVDIEEVLSNIEWSLEKKIKAANAVITTHLEVKAVYFSPKNLRSILYNLISNAIKFASLEQPRVHIRTRQDGKFVVLSVEDNGIGISPEGIRKLFTVYGRLNAHVEGHGVGLYLANKIIHAAGGDLRVESAPGAGSKFSIYLKNM